MNKFILLLFTLIGAYAITSSQYYEVEDSDTLKLKSPKPGMLNIFDTLSTMITPIEVMAVAAESEVSYSLMGIYDEDNDSIPRELAEYDSLIVLPEDFYYDKEKGPTVYQFTDAFAKKMYDKAEMSFMTGNFADARMNYYKTLEADPNVFICSLYIAQTYKPEGNQKEYEKKLEEFLESYPSHPLGLRLKALDLVAIEEYEDALEYTIKSSIYNRNNPMNKITFDYSLNQEDMEYDTWEFIPKFQVTKYEPGKIEYVCDSNWVLASINDLVYEIDPSVRRRARYKGDLGRERQLVMLLSLIGGEYEDRFEDNHDKALAVLHEAIEEDMFMGYFYYEVLLPRYPYYGVMLTDEAIEMIAEYIEEFRYVEKKENE